ncbi:hypothetical protein N7492_001726 [Penicillium capsulatum]|uniref:Zn(2)-C6 fungal-type domain-containing protein n=1 Tax=Penicillium capsulatum TaxID=69766 RepID=A0A9W9IW46_9EURO|nr:hypothetical protein N7492_001726 [Penicillium capsulatum]KAJ6129223.1 hypothetical protein N7512_002003 [Penicillium capsulatum]
MQPLVLHPPSLTTPQFGQPRFTGPGLPLNRPWSNARGCSPRAPLARQSMPDSPSAEPSVTSGESKPSTYPPVSGPTASLPAPSQSGLAEPLPAPVLPRYGEPSIPPAFTSSPRPPPGAPQYPLPLDPSGPGSSTRALTQKSTRRTKAHVASACVNCKKKHLGCDPARPCRRCVLAGKASSCVDVTHKKRGRPPLKAEDSSLRSFSTHMDNPAVPAEVQPPGTAPRGVLHRTTSSRELRPMTDLQVGETGPAAMRVPRGQPHRWSASVFPLTRPMDPSPVAPGPASRRPFSSSGPPSYAPPAHPPSAFVPITSGFHPVLKPGVLPPGIDRRYPPYPGPALPPPTSPPQHQLPAGVPYPPYADVPGSSMHHSIPDPHPRMPPGPREPYLESPLRLPPIHQATASPGPPGPPPPPGPQHTHRLSDPYPASWTASAREEHTREPRSPAGPLPGPMGPMFSHTHQRSSSNAGPLDLIPRHLGPIDLPSPVPPGQSPTSLTQPPPSTSTEAESGEPRPVKRRKMALDDMVNG